MPGKLSQPYQPLLLRILHGVTGICAIAAILTAAWTYDTYDGRFGRFFLPKLEAIEGIHGTFGLWTLLIFPIFVVYAFRRGQKRLIQPDSLQKLSQPGKPIFGYTLHRITNTLAIFALTFALFSGKMMSEKWLPQGELNHTWYYLHLISWVVLVLAIAFHLLMAAKVGGTPLLLSIMNWKFRSQDSPSLWRKNISEWKANFRLDEVFHPPNSAQIFRVLEAIILITIILAWVISIVKELG
ncbi:cytochrome b/b6 domain-containing protein [Limnoraphis robusta]|uniref:Cytochrome b/b6 domain-containing protein n=1 Tax=Limnoraphis robusta CCNP1315 TaxID=3110306 RepID=A0ABU5U2C0_9CYAN|nr:cytochrome b/b6 domain-containing protein [Limnoraphis robusta]MEA5520273.1 cytochrome b/b6 domain-containing protein [Limnoraphis robusta CCNP1315]MEA5548539.1 cytochrome b/b6 domain-containing protein [Limnoraphis robusta CCNP1324]